MSFGMNLWSSCMELYGILRFCMVNSFVPKSRVLLEFLPNLRFLEIRVGKTPYGTR